MYCQVMHVLKFAYKLKFLVTLYHARDLSVASESFPPTR